MQEGQADLFDMAVAGPAAPPENVKVRQSEFGRSIGDFRFLVQISGKDAKQNGDSHISKG